MTTKLPDTLLVSGGAGGGSLTEEQVQDYAWNVLTGTQTLITVTYQDGTNDVDFVVDNDLSNYSNATSGFITASSTETLTNKSGNISQWTNDAGYITATLTAEQVQDYVGAMFTGNTETLITVTYQDADGTIDLVVDNDLANYSNTNAKFVTSDTTGVTGADAIPNIMSLTTAEYGAIGTPDAATIYIITDA